MYVVEVEGTAGKDTEERNDPILERYESDATIVMIKSTVKATRKFTQPQMKCTER